MSRETQTDAVDAMDAVAMTSVASAFAGAVAMATVVTAFTVAPAVAMVRNSGPCQIFNIFSKMISLLSVYYSVQSTTIIIKI